MTFDPFAHGHLLTLKPTTQMQTATLEPSGYIAEIAGRNYMIDEGQGRIQFLDSRFYQVSPGKYVPSVTTILEAYPKGAQYYEWLKKHGQDADEIRDEAGRRGSVVHGLTELFDAGVEIALMTEEGSPKYKLNEWAMFERYVDFRKRHPAAIHAVELNMVSGALGYAGTLDRVLTIDGTTYLMDIKTSGAIYDSYWMQQAAYLELLIQTGHIAKLFPDGEVPEIKLAILWLNANTRSYPDTTPKKDGTPRKTADNIQGPGWQFIPQKEATSDLLDMFDCVHAVWLKANKNMLPRTTSYKLKHSL